MTSACLSFVGCPVTRTCWSIAFSPYNPCTLCIMCSMRSAEARAIYHCTNGPHWSEAGALAGTKCSGHCPAISAAGLLQRRPAQHAVLLAQCRNVKHQTSMILMISWVESLIAYDIFWGHCSFEIRFVLRDHAHPQYPQPQNSTPAES